MIDGRLLLLQLVGVSSVTASKEGLNDPRELPVVSLELLEVLAADRGRLLALLARISKLLLRIVELLARILKVLLQLLLALLSAVGIGGVLWER